MISLLQYFPVSVNYVSKCGKQLNAKLKFDLSSTELVSQVNKLRDLCVFEPSELYNYFAELCILLF